MDCTTDTVTRSTCVPLIATGAPTFDVIRVSDRTSIRRPTETLVAPIDARRSGGQILETLDAVRIALWSATRRQP
jgi:hypothetical protein